MVAPVAGITVMGGTVYIAAGSLGSKNQSKPLNGVYLLVKGSVTSTADSSATLTKTTGTSPAKTTKNYYCQVTLEGNKTTKDESCSLFKLNAASTATDVIALNQQMFADTQLAATYNAVSTTSHHILKVSPSFYQKLSSSKDPKNIDIKISNSTDATKHFGSVQEIVNLNLKTTADFDNPNTKLFLARIKTPATSSATFTQPLSCKLSKELSVECNLYKLETAQAKTNLLTKEHLSKATALTAHTDIGSADNYVIVELSKQSIKANKLKNVVIEINKKAKPTDSEKTTNKIADAVFDQVLFGKAGKTTDQSVIFPLVARQKTYIVEKQANSDGFAEMTTTDTKNYKCKFTSGTDVNYDDSCVLKVFPANPTLHAYSTMTGEASTFKGIANGEITSKEHFLLTVDSNKLFNLKPNWKTDTELKVVAIVGDTDSKNTTFKLLNEVTVDKATGKTNHLFLKYKSTDATSAVNTSGQCSFTEDAVSSFPCVLNKATISAPATNPAFTDTTFTNASSPTTENFHSLTDPTYFAAKLTTSKNITEFETTKQIFFTSTATPKQKVIFDFVATMGGSIESSKTAFFLEAPRTTTSNSQ